MGNRSGRFFWATLYILCMMCCVKKYIRRCNKILTTSRSLRSRMMTSPSSSSIVDSRTRSDSIVVMSSRNRHWSPSWLRTSLANLSVSYKWKDIIKEKVVDTFDISSCIYLVFSKYISHCISIYLSIHLSVYLCIYLTRVAQEKRKSARSFLTFHWSINSS